MSFNDKLQKLRKESGLSQEQLADLLDVTRQSVSKWESGMTYPEMDKLIAMCKIFKCSLDDLTNDEISEIKPSKKENALANLLDSFLDIINKTINMLKTMSVRDIIKCLFTLILFGLVLLLLKLPFDFLISGFNKIVYSLNRPVLADFLSSCFSFIVDAIYIVLYIFIYIYVYKTAYLDKYEKVLENKKETERPDTHQQVLSDNQRTYYHSKVHDKSNTFFSLLSTMILWLIKFLVGGFALLVIFSLIGLMALLAIDLYLIIRGVYYFGPFIIMISSLIGGIVIISLMLSFIFNKTLAFKKLLWAFIIALLGIGLGSGLFAIEIYNTDYVEEIKNNNKNIKTIIQEFEMQPDLLVDYYIQELPNNVIYIEDNTLTSNIKIEAKYNSENLTHIAMIKYDNIITIIEEHINDFKEFKIYADKIIKDLHHKKIYDYSYEGIVSLTIYANKENIVILKNNADKEILKYEKTQQMIEDNINIINELEEKINNYQETISEYEIKINNLEEEKANIATEFAEYKEKINNISNE